MKIIIIQEEEKYNDCEYAQNMITDFIINKPINNITSIDIVTKK